MSVDKFGHYLNDNSGIISLKNASKMLGFFMDSNNNIDVQNKRIKNVAKAVEENDVINKLFLQNQIEEIEYKLLKYFKEDNNKMHDTLRTQIEMLQHAIILQLEENKKIEESLFKIKTFLEDGYLQRFVESIEKKS